MSTDTAPRTGLTRLDKAQTEHLAHWMSLALEQMPFFASIAYALRPLNAPGLGTFAVDDGLRLYIDFDAVLGELNLTPAQCGQALLHEFSHVWRDHSGRAKESNVTMPEAKISNVAADAEINDDLVQAGCAWLGEFGVVPAKIGQPDNQTFEFYLDALRTMTQQQREGGCSECGRQGNSGDQQDQDPGQQGDAGGQASASNPCGTCGQDKGRYAGCGSISGGEPAPCELPSDDDLDGQAPAASQVTKDNAITRTAAAIVEQARNGRGNAPAGMVEHAELMLKPAQVPWQRVLSSQFRRAVAKQLGKTRRTYTRRNRRRHNVRLGNSAERVIYPGSYSPKINVLFVRDTSGSMGIADLNGLGSEIVTISRSMKIKGEALRVMDVDAAVHAVTPYKDVTTLSEVHGRGGTDMGAGIEAAMDLKVKPDVIIVGTDGFTPWPEQNCTIPVIVCLVGSGEMIEAAKEHYPVPSWMTVVEVRTDKG